MIQVQVDIRLYKGEGGERGPQGIPGSKGYPGYQGEHGPTGDAGLDVGKEEIDKYSKKSFTLFWNLGLAWSRRSYR